MKRIVAILLVVCLVIPAVFVPTEAASSKVITSEQIEKAISWGQKYLSPSDSSVFYGLCAAFVFHAYNEGAGISNSSYSTATAMGNALITHTDSNPPRGALVFWYVPDVPAGHVALSLGNGNIIHAWGNKPYCVVSGTVKNVSNYYGASNYRGWGAPIAGYTLATESGTNAPALNASISVNDYMTYYATVTAMNTPGRINVSSAQTWKLPWTDNDNSTLKLEKISGTVTILNKVVNHAGNTWYEYKTSSGTRGFVYGNSVDILPYWSGNSISGITTNNAVFKGQWNNPDQLNITKGGFYYGTKSNPVSTGTKITDTVASGTETVIYGSYDLKNEYNITLAAGTKYYYRFFAMESNGTYHYSPEYSFTTSAVKVTSVTVSPSSSSLNLGKTVQLSASVAPSNATNKGVTWSSSNTSVATVSSSGLVTAKAVGTATITATANDGSGKKGTCTVTVSCAHSWKDATCTTAKVCTVCGATSGSSLGHSWRDATCTAAKTCTRCGTTTGSSLGHDWRAATCTAAKTCNRCGGTEGSSLGHAWKDATCNDPKTCTRCGTTTGSSLGHDWKAATCTAAKTCNRCGGTEGSSLGHDWKDATCNDPKTCNRCGGTEGSALGHDWKEANCDDPKTCNRCGGTEGSSLGHDWKDATCNDPKTCNRCGGTEGSALGHDWKDATCNDPKTCNRCGGTEGSALGHDWKDATCNDPKTCTRCGGTEGSSLGHDWKDATCNDPKTCTRCGGTEGSALGHDWKEANCDDPKTCERCGTATGSSLGHAWKDATCSDPKTCNRCGTTTGDSLGHDWGNADCNEPATCGRCGTTTGSALGHDWKDATCSEPKTCNRCGTTTGSSLGHDWKDATCSEPRTCERCGTSTGSSLGHAWKAATCSEPKTCSRCGTTTGDSLGHDWGNADCNEPATCGRCGTTTGSSLGHNWKDATCNDPKTCNRCGGTEGSSLGHDWKNATCSEPKTCERCGTSIGSSLGHAWKAATCSEPKTCSRCGTTTGDSLGHDWGNADCNEPATCGRCGTTTGSSLGHDWKDATCSEPKTCNRCGTTTGSSLGHDWKNATCSEPKTCERCGTSIGSSLGHAWKDATCNDPKTCNRCGTATGSALGHSWVDANCLKPKTCSRCKTTTGGLGDHGYENGSCIFCGQGADDAVIRLYGSDRFDTAFTVANEMKDNLGVEKFSAVIVASGKDFADALSASYLAAVNKAPILLSYKSNQNRQVADYIRGNLAEGGLVYIIGGTSAVPVEMEDLLSGLRVKRLAGENRFETNLAVLKEAGIPAGEEILVCTGSDFADCLSAAAAGKPIMLVYKRLMDSQKAYIPTLNNRFCIIGGTNAVNSTVEDFINDYGATTRLAGNHRYETSVMVAQKYFGSPDGAVLAYARNFPDGLCGGVLAATAGMPLVLTDSKYYSYAADYTAEKGIRGGYVLGGEALISGKAAGAVLGG